MLLIEDNALYNALRCTKSQNKNCTTCPYAVFMVDNNALLDYCDTEAFERDALDKILEHTQVPTIEPVKRGNWIMTGTMSECSLCHEFWHYITNQTERFNFCPNCGADMRTEAQHE